MAARASAARRTSRAAGRTAATAATAATSRSCAIPRCATCSPFAGGRSTGPSAAATAEPRSATAPSGETLVIRVRRARRSAPTTARSTTSSVPASARSPPAAAPAAAATSISRRRPARARISPSAACPARSAGSTLELKLLADVGLVGLPNAGKSTLLSRLTRAAPKIADYPFTTLEPVLGTLEDDDRQLVLADIPGLIEGASEGAGLGHEFLAHVERTRLLVHVLDLAPLDGSDPERNHATIEAELERHDPRLAALPRVLALSKADLVEPAAARRARRGLARAAAGGRPRDRHLERHPRGPRRAHARAAARGFRSSRSCRSRRPMRGGRDRARRAPRLPARDDRGFRVERSADGVYHVIGRASTACSRAMTSTTTRRSRTSSRGCAGSASSGRCRTRASRPATTSRSAASSSSWMSRGRRRL